MIDATELRNILRAVYCLDYDDYLGIMGDPRSDYSMGKWKLMQSDFTRWFCDLDSENAKKFLSRILRGGRARLWLRVGVDMDISSESLEALKQGEVGLGDVFTAALKEKNVSLSGETYAPAINIDGYDTRVSFDAEFYPTGVLTIADK